MARDVRDRVNITLRIPEGLRARLETAASSDDRSLNAEIAARLDRSFNESETLAVLFGDDRISAFVLTIAGCLRLLRPVLGDEPWRSNPEGCKLIRGSVGAVTDAFTAPDPPPAPDRKNKRVGPPTPKPDAAALAAHLAGLLKPPGGS